MEDTTIILVVSLIGVFSLVAMKLLQGKTKVKQTKISADQQLNNVFQDTIKRQAVELKKQVGRANRFQALYQNLDTDELEDIDPKGGGKEVEWSDIEKLVKTSYPQYAHLLENAAVRYYVQSKIKGMTLEEVIEEIKPFMGNIKPQGKTQQDELQNSNQFA